MRSSKENMDYEWQCKDGSAASQRPAKEGVALHVSLQRRIQLCRCSVSSQTAISAIYCDSLKTPVF